ncbi:MAG TPA: TetR/AcrR family transcriptional regulator [Pyrinomonadaceae bacterium]|nr:TetR/AcrR family transcriptional regulator [Pyrinomonadaceae bacterium]
MEVFWAKGYEATSLQDLIDAMGLSKSSFYNAFDSKHHLFTETLRHYNECMTTPLASALMDSKSGLTFIKAVFEEIIDQSKTSAGMKGCFLMNTATEFAQSDPEIGSIMNSGLKKIETIFHHAILKAQDAGEIPADKDASALAKFLVSNMSGLKTMVKAGIKPAHLLSIVNTLVASLNA